MIYGLCCEGQGNRLSSPVSHFHTSQNPLSLNKHWSCKREKSLFLNLTPKANKQTQVCCRGGSAEGGRRYLSLARFQRKSQRSKLLAAWLTSNPGWKACQRQSVSALSHPIAQTMYHSIHSTSRLWCAWVHPVTLSSFKPVSGWMLLTLNLYIYMVPFFVIKLANFKLEPQGA